MVKVRLLTVAAGTCSAGIFIRGAVRFLCRYFGCLFFADCMNSSDWDAVGELVLIFNGPLSSQKIKNYIVELCLSQAVIHPPLLTSELFYFCRG